MNFNNLFSTEGRISRDQYRLSSNIFTGNFALGFLIFTSIQNSSIFFIVFLVWFLFLFIHLIHMICQRIKRGHDLGLSGRDALFPFDFSLSSKQGMTGKNKYGPDPLERENI